MSAPRRDMPGFVRIINGKEVEDYDNFCDDQAAVWDFMTSNDRMEFEMEWDEAADRLTITVQ